MIFFLATLITSTIFITDRLEGIWDRTLVAGISTSELLLAHILTQSFVMLIQCGEIVILAAFIFDTNNHGDNLTVIVLLMMLGFSGMLYGLFISIFCDSHTMANFMATGSFYPMIILCGKTILTNQTIEFFSNFKIHFRNFLATRRNATLPSIHRFSLAIYSSINRSQKCSGQRMDNRTFFSHRRLRNHNHLDCGVINALHDRS